MAFEKVHSWTAIQLYGRNREVSVIYGFSTSMTFENYSNITPLGKAATPYQVPLFSPADEAGFYHRPDSGGYFSLLTSLEGGHKVQHSYPTLKMPVVLSLIDANRDTWISQAEFWSSLRRVVNVKSIGLAFLDIDFYREDIEWGRGRTPERAAEDFVGLCDDFGIPRPSLIIYSGRGLQVKWFFVTALPRMAMPRWNAVEKVLVEKFAFCGADPLARDSARVLRLVQTVNTKSKQVCRPIWVNTDENNQPVRYDFEYFAECVLPIPRSVARQHVEIARQTAKTPRSGVSRGLTIETLNWNRVEDLRTIVRLRSGMPEGLRMQMLFYTLNFLALSHQVTPTTFYYEAAAIAREIDPTWTMRSAELKTVYAKMKDYLAGKTVEFNGRTYPALYTPTNDTLINVFGITNEEQKELKTIIDDTEQYRRKVEGRRAEGMMSRFDYVDRAEQRSVQAMLLRGKGLSMRQIAKEMKVSVGSVAGYLKGCSKSVL